MKKISFPPGNAFCPACLYLYGTYREDGQPNYGLFTWAAYAWDEGLRFVACIGEDKLTRDRIRAQGVFSASVVSEALLPAADFCGNHAGYAVDKSRRIPSGRGAVLPVPVPEESPWTLELQVERPCAWTRREGARSTSARSATSWATRPWRRRGGPLPSACARRARS